jgi:hypothetical protein
MAQLTKYATERYPVVGPPPMVVEVVEGVVDGDEPVVVR